jgi:hypothetical protein
MLVDLFCNKTEPHLRFTLIVNRLIRGRFNIVAVGSYVARAVPAP